MAEQKTDVMVKIRLKSGHHSCRDKGGKRWQYGPGDVFELRADIADRFIKEGRATKAESVPGSKGKLIGSNSAKGEAAKTSE